MLYRIRKQHRKYYNRRLSSQKIKMHTQLGTGKLFSSISSESAINGYTCLQDLRTSGNVEIFEAFDLSHHQFFCSSLGQEKSIKAKIFKNGGQGLLEIFAVQLLELCCLDLKSNDETEIKYVSTIGELIEKPQFQLLFTEQQNLIFNTSTQEDLKQIIMQFLHGLIKSSKGKNVKQLIIQHLNMHPLVIKLIVSILRQLLYLGDLYKDEKSQLEMQSTFQFLACYFGVQASIDLQNNCIYFSKTNTYVYQENTKTFYMINAENKNQQIAQVSQVDSQSKKSISSSQFSQIDVEQFSNILNSKQRPSELKQKKQQATVVISQLNICPEPIQQKLTTVTNCKTMQSQIISGFKQKTVKMSEIINNSNQIKSQMKQNTAAVTTTSSLKQFAGSVKDYIQTPTVLQSQLFDTVRYHQCKQNNMWKKYTKLPLTNNTNYLNGVYHKLDNYGQPSFKPKLQTEITSPIAKNFVPYYFPQSYRGMQKLKPVKWVNKNITSQFTDSKILQKIAQPYRSSIKAKKSKARQERKNLYYNFNSFV